MLAERRDFIDRAPTELGYEELMYEFTDTVSTALNPERIYDAALRALGAALGARKASILVLDADGVMRFKAWQNLSDGYRRVVEGHSPWEPSEPDAQPVLVRDVLDDLSLEPLQPALAEEGIRALAFIPLRVGSRLLGKFMLYYPEPHDFSHREMVVARTIAANVAFAIDHHRDRANLVSRQSHLQAMLRSSVTGIAEIGPDAAYVMVNDRFCEIVGWTREELIGSQTCPGITHPDDREETNDCIAALVSGGEHFTIEKRYVRADGGVVWASSSFSAIRDETGRLSGALIVVTDITERKLIDEAIRSSEERYRTLVSALGVAVYTTDATGRITLFNDASAQLWGRTPLLGQDMWCGSWRIYTPEGEEMPLESCPMAIALQEDRPVRDVEIVVERPDGSRSNVLPYPTPLHDTMGKLVGAVNVLVDITELKATQAALEEAIRAKDDFLGQVSHELRTPITQIGGNAEVLVRRWEQMSREMQQSSLEEINAQTKRMQRLIDNMMVLSRLERGIVPDMEPHLVQRLIGETVTLFKERFPETRISLSIERNIPPVETSASTIDQVVWNLLTNAQKYGPPEGPIAIEGGAVDGWVEVRVLDHGPGAPERDLDRLFEPYFRSSTIPEHAAGIGLGLSVCKRLVEAQGGELWARRRPEGGMEFGMRLPTLNVDAHQE